jgi:hypothetical protein
MPLVGSVAGKFAFGRQPANAGTVISSGLQLNLDAGNSTSYGGSGTTWYDLTANARNATLYNTPTYSSSQGGYFSFADTSFEYAAVPNIGNLTQWTVESWARPTASLSGKVTAVVCNEFDLGSKLNFSLGTNRAPTSYNLCAGYYNGAWRTTDGFTPSLNTWYQIVGTYDGTTLRQYTNGVAGTPLAYSGTPQSGGEIRIARRWDSSANDATNFFKGDISIVRIYNRALSGAEVLENYDAVKGRYGLA